MKKRCGNTGLSLVYLLMATLSASQAVYADWSGDKLYKGYNQRYGDFPPADIDAQLSDATKHAKQKTVETEKTAEVNAAAPANSAAAATTANSKPAVTPPAQAAATQPVQQPAYGNYYQNGYYVPPGRWGYDRRSNYYGPWNNRSGFAGPWNYRGSGYRGPWYGNGSGFRPWGNGAGWRW